MDSVTQIALGSAVAYTVLGKSLGRASLIIGAALGTLPDLDVLVDFGGAVENFVFHRSFSHSLIVQAMIAPMITWLFLYFNWAKKVSFRRWTIAIYMILSTHSILDSCTVYGTQLLWPISDYPYGISSLFIIDPLYTLPLLFSLLSISFIANRDRATKINTMALILSSLYAVWSLGAKIYIDQKIHVAMAQRELHSPLIVSTPAPFNTLLWRAVAMTPNGHYEIYVSVFDQPQDISFYFYETKPELLSTLDDQQGIKLLSAFTKGFYGVYQQEDEVLLSDLRMGVEGAYVFTFRVGKIQNDQVRPHDFSQISKRPPLSQVAMLWDRIWDPSVDLSLANRQD